MDFYCPAEKLAVELDGMQHFTEDGIKYDETRTEYLQKLGIRVIRFENAEVFERTNEVLEAIKNCFRKYSPSPRDTPPENRRGAD